MSTNVVSADERPGPVSFFEAMRYWFKLGFISFGGPTGQISMMHQELVEKRRWISEHRFLHALNYTMVLPGPEAQQLATYIGWLMHGVWGGIAAGVLFVLPSLFILIGLTWAYLSFGDVPAVEGILYGIKPAVTAIVVFAAYRIGSRALSNNILRGMALLAFACVYFLSVPFPYIILGAGIIAFIGSRYVPEKFTAGAHGSSKDSYGLAIIDDDTPIPKHAKFKWSKAITCFLIGVILWAAVIFMLYSTYDMEGTLTQMGVFFSKAAMVTFGGAYAVLPYIVDGAVGTYSWATSTQMIDGLALGETTPGPLIMIVAFVGFVGSWSNEIFGSDSLLLAGVAGASVATLFTFLPSFVFILVGGPAVEATRGDIKFTAPLTGITAAVVGVILNLAVFFALAVLWPALTFEWTNAFHVFIDGVEAAKPVFEWFAALIGLSAFVALIRYKADIMLVIAASAIIGLVYTLMLVEMETGIFSKL